MALKFTIFCLNLNNYIFLYLFSLGLLLSGLSSYPGISQLHMHLAIVMGFVVFIYYVCKFCNCLVQNNQ